MAPRYVGGYDAAALSAATGLRCQDPSLAVQSQAEEADINTIVRNFGITGKLPENVRAPSYGDFREGITDFRSALDAVKAAEQSFMAMPSELRARLDNDPQQFLDWCGNPDNLSEMKKYGLIPADDPPASDTPQAG